MKRKYILLVLSLLFVFTQCEHEPFPAPSGGFIDNPQDSSHTGEHPCHPDTIYYNRDIQPILSSNCAFAGCHGQIGFQKGVQLTNYQQVMATADVRPGDLKGSDLYEVITDEDEDDRMPPPPSNRLSSEDIELIRRWILQGAQNLFCDDCDTNNLRYPQIAAIVKSHCLACHNTANPITPNDLSTYPLLKEAMQNTNLLQRVQLEPNVPPMPPSLDMSECKQRALVIWYESGMPQ